MRTRLLYRYTLTTTKPHLPIGAYLRGIPGGYKHYMIGAALRTRFGREE